MGECYFYLLNFLCRGIALALMFVAAQHVTLHPSLIRSYSLVRLIFAAVGQTFSLSLNPLTAVPLVLCDSRALLSSDFNSSGSFALEEIMPPVRYGSHQMCLICIVSGVHTSH